MNEKNVILFTHFKSSSVHSFVNYTHVLADLGVAYSSLWQRQCICVCMYVYMYLLCWKHPHMSSTVGGVC